MTSEAVRPISVGQLLAERYRLIDLVRPADGMDVSLWQGRDEVLQRTVAIHLHEPGGLAARPLLVAAKRGGRVNHPGLANVFDAGDTGVYAFVVSEWVEGTPLAHAVLREDIDDDEAVAVLRELSEAVEAAHREGVVHGRLTADRVLLTDSGARITGIGFAPESAAPEDDVRALGALLYAMVTGYWPLPGATSLPHVDLVAGAVPPPRRVDPSAPADLEHLCMRILEPETGRGGPIRSAAVLTAVLSSRPWTTVAAPPPRHFWARKVAVLGMLVVAAILGWFIGVLLGTVPEAQDANVAASPRPQTTPTGSPSPGGTGPYRPPATPPAPAPLVPVAPTATLAFDPFGDDRENDAAVPRAFDGDRATAWTTERYYSRADFAGLKPGVGLLVDLGRPADIRAVMLELPVAGLSLEIRAGDEMSDSLDDFPIVAQSTVADVSVRTTLPASVLARYWVVWLTGLVPDPTKQNTFRGGISEVTLSE